MKEMYGYRAQFDRLIRQLAIADAPGDKVIAKEDDCINVFLHAWTLKDHVKKDLSLQPDVRDRLDKAVHHSPTLAIAQQIANGSKHFTDYPAKMIGNHDVTVFVGSHVAYYPSITFDDGTQRRAIDVAHEVVDEWRRLFAGEGIVV
jgi:hypothetical protein